VKPDYPLFDFDGHYYEARDAFTRHADRKLGARGVQWVEANGRAKLVVGGALNSFIPNPTFEPKVSRPGALYHWYRGNPQKLDIKDAFGELEPTRAAYRNRDARLAAMDEQNVGATTLFPTLGVGIEDALKHDAQAAYAAFAAFNRWLEDDWGLRYKERIFAVPYVPMLDPAAARAALEALLKRGAIIVNIRNAPIPVPGGHRSPFEPDYDGFWGLAEEAGVVVATHAGLDGYDVVVNMWEKSTENSIFRSPLRGVISKGRAVSDFYGAAVCQLLFERFPKLRMVSVENGAGWIPDLLHRLEDAANRQPRYFKVHPVEAFNEHVWATPFWEDDVQQIVARVPAERMLLGSDWPHAEGVVAPADFVDASLAWCDAPTLRKIARDNALELLRLPVQ
jgi:predicted TIM-barrel fold metal-dependent hydrolase